jgi:hypothetical protein
MILVVKSKGGRLPEGSSPKWKDINKMNIKEAGCELRAGFNWLKTGPNGGIL